MSVEVGIGSGGFLVGGKLGGGCGATIGSAKATGSIGSGGIDNSGRGGLGEVIRLKVTMVVDVGGTGRVLVEGCICGCKMSRLCIGVGFVTGSLPLFICRGCDLPSWARGFDMGYVVLLAVPQSPYGAKESRDPVCMFHVN
ncbi:hypothetical protein D5086_017457 [Populus alba]|uniref:Uncharacterized protein n=1 Tax=Populus alba TaxID=43335 RepID=A0ACC4BNB9_POPAL